jgi:hypothetical protein
MERPVEAMMAVNFSEFLLRTDDWHGSRPGWKLRRLLQ